jgi:uncharacterized protein YodC (DUF2158 family)
MKIGEIVSLTAGGPQMSVETILQARLGRQPIRCFWFDRGRLVRGVFDIRVLKKVTSDAKASGGY